jgi:hypothetical protein
MPADGKMPLICRSAEWTGADATNAEHQTQHGRPRDGMQAINFYEGIV